MNQMNWVFLDDSGRRHRIGLMHGPRSGHVLIYCNARISIIDFNVKSSKEYSLFIEDQLCHIGIHREDKEFTYNFAIDRDADIPYNALQKEQRRRDLKWTLITAIGFMAVVVTTIWYFSSQSDLWERNQALLESPIALQGRVVGTESADGVERIIYTVTGPKGRVQSSIDLESENGVLLMALPFTVGDTLDFTAFSEDYGMHRIRTDYPFSGYHTLYSRVEQSVQKRYPELSDFQVECILDRAGEEDGILGLAEIKKLLLSTDSQKRVEDWNPKLMRRLLKACDHNDHNQ